MWPGDNELPQVVEVCGRDGLREGKLARKDRGYANLIGLDVHVG